MKNITGNPNPRVAIVNVGAEEEKGNALVKETFPLLKACDNINFIGSIEARDITDGYADVIVCDAFVGNVILKMFEGVASTLLHGIKDAIMSSFKSKIGGLLIKDSLKSLLKTYDVASYGGAPMLGLRGLVVKTHGNAEAIEIQNALGQCINFTEQKLTEQFQTGVSLKTRKTAAADNAETRTE
jgi:glycerol-3-phosphate acyltransferase PlsX